ncbi:MAG: hypothetical protein QM756_38735 [Polyangiaceae bacterium]
MFQPRLAGLAQRTCTLIAAAACFGCSSGSDDAPGSGGATLYFTNNVVFGDEIQTTYLKTLSSLEAQQVDLANALELPGWADAWVYGSKLFVADGEAPELTRYGADAQGKLLPEGKLSFQNYGATQVAFWGQLFVSSTKAYWFNTSGREVVVWNPSTFKIERTFPLAELADRGAEKLVGPSANRAAVVRGKRAYVPFYWANWDDYTISEDSVVLVLDTESDSVLDVLSVPCPEINFVSSDDAGTIYFSNWGFSAVPTLLDGKAHACAVRLLPGADTLDPKWSLSFADVTEGREASALRWLGDGKAMITVFHSERAELEGDVDRYALTDSANWRQWLLDLNSLTAAPLDGLGWHAPGLYGTRIDGHSYLAVPSGEYADTSTYGVASDGSAELLWKSPGWQTRLFGLNR